MASKSSQESFDFKGGGAGVNQCDMCGGDTYVKDSRTTLNGLVRRRRSCKFCGESFTTYESRRNPIEMENKLKSVFKELQVMTKVKKLLDLVDFKEDYRP